MRSATISVGIPVVISLLPAALAAQQPSKEMAQAVAAYAAKITASAVFISGRSLDSVLAQELAPTLPLEVLIKPLLRFDVDQELQRVTCRLGTQKATAQLWPSLGCTLIVSDEAPSKQRREFVLPSAPAAAKAEDDEAARWPQNEVRDANPTTGIDL